ncbi:two-component system alkaline phosphatase synthesis response regulator PhoP [Pullulanibacillus pueri]|uniref:DNA-binding response regulator n=1 Tax=Pullulanibacillus pueri TaxID=1437324 RepID=A0A8J3EKR7_9BACL|nr:response regulator transcription factor [Pullulanibacillus pueri]MBM7680348.1 two-component system alkaline phosphatase synthesis response regulator PhoP [Pullulanibacillus pueri]GGH75520.1 DNA-binding response regulator [Pullulanibacillus pueri]
MAKKILVVDDEESIVTLVQFHLKKEGFDVLAASDGTIALHLAQEERPDLIILDLMLPGMDGLDVCRHLRQKQLNIPIVMLTAKDDEFDKVLGLELGADDYLTKPFSPRELVARVKAVLRRTGANEQVGQEDEEEIIKIGELEVLPEEYKAFFRGEEMELTPKEFELLLFLSRNKKRVMSRDQLLSAVWDYDFAGDTRIVDVHISHLREKIEDNTKKPIYIKTIRGFGYKMETPK